MNHEYFCVLLSQQLWIQTEMFNLLWQQVLTLSWLCCSRSSLNDGECLIAVAAILLLRHLVSVAFAATPLGMSNLFQCLIAVAAILLLHHFVSVAFAATLGISNPFQLLSQQPGCFT